MFRKLLFLLAQLVAVNFTLAMQTFDMNEILQSQLCVMSGFSSNHFQQGLNLVLTTQQFHPCLKMYIHDLGLMPHEKAFLSSFPFITMREFKMNQELFPGGACAFKPPLILNFMKAYGAEHKCRFVLYGDASIMMHAKLDADLIEEVLRNGIATDSPVKYWQISFTHPAMYEYFGFNRESDFRTSDKGRMKQTQAGLMMFDSLNYTLRDTFFNEWAECATNPACLTPDNIITNKLPPNAPSELYPLRDGTKVFRAHRDDQSAYTFLLHKYFGMRHATDGSRKVFISRYVHPYYRSQVSPQMLRSQLDANNTVCPSKPHKVKVR